MNTTAPSTATESRRVQPLVAAGALWVLGVVLGRYAGSAGWVLGTAGAAWALWLIAERRHWATVAQGGLAALLVAGGAALWVLDQRHIESNHVVRYAAQDGETLIVMRARVIASPADTAARGNRYWMARASGIWTESGWRAAHGDLLVRWSAGDESPALQRGARVEISGWLSRPQPARNPGALDPRRKLAADRVFAQARVPRPGGVTVLESGGGFGLSPLAWWRGFLRGKLLEHLIDEDVPAAHTLTALLLGHREAAIGDVSQAFADAGVAHLLAISGSHIVFFTSLAWAVLRMVPLSPRWRELAIGAVVGAYVLATPCGPPIMRAAVALIMVIGARLMGRPRQYLQILAAAVIAVLLIRPADIDDAGFQLSFVTTAGLILLSQRLYRWLFEGYFARRELVTELAGGRWRHWRLAAERGMAGLLVANLIGATTAMPLVAYHFGQVNLWAVATGLLALPIVVFSMVGAAAQLLVELVSSTGGGWLAPVTAMLGRSMIWQVERLASLPGAAVAVRPPPAWVALAACGGLAAWAFRRNLRITRAQAANVLLATLTAAAGWYAWSAPRGAARITVLSPGTDGSCILLRDGAGRLWNIDAAGVQGRSLLSGALRPALRLAGTRQLEGQIVTALSAGHARHADAVIDEFSPRRLYVPAGGWEVRGHTLAGIMIDDACRDRGVPVCPLRAGDRLDLGAGLRVEVLWPPANGDDAGGSELMLLIDDGVPRVLIGGAGACEALPLVLHGRPSLRCEVMIVTAPQRGSPDEGPRQLARDLGARHLIWSGRGPWAPRQAAAGEWNAADGAIHIELGGELQVRPAGG